MDNKFSDFSQNSRYNNSNLNNYIKNNMGNLNNVDNKEINEMINLITKYSSMHPNMVLAELMKIVNMRKQNGTFNVEYINNIKNSLFPYLSPQQKEIFNNLFNTLR